jgi:hypothetical protein
MSATDIYACLRLLYQLLGAFMVGAADGVERVVGALVVTAITVVEDWVSGVERPTRRVSIAIATSPVTPATTESLLGRWPDQLSASAC